MTVVELVGMSQGEANTALMLSDSGLAVLTGYLLIAYFMGEKLTLFQVTFVNTLFLLTRLANFLSLQGVVQRNAYWNDKIREIDPSIPFGLFGHADRGSILSWVIFGAVTFGAILFMWQVRHPKAD